MNGIHKAKTVRTQSHDVTKRQAEFRTSHKECSLQNAEHQRYRYQENLNYICPAQMVCAEVVKL